MKHDDENPVQYVMLRQDIPAEMTVKVNDYLSVDNKEYYWELYGTPFSSDYYIYQALVKYKKYTHQSTGPR